MNQLITKKTIALLGLLLLLASPAKVTAQSHAASLELVLPSNRFFVVGDSIKLGVRINAPVAVNAARVIINYDPTQVVVTHLDTGQSFCDPGLFIEKIVDNKTGRVIISCGKPNPGLIGAGEVASLEFKLLKFGKTKISIGRDSQVLANDGFGSEVLGEITDIELKIKNQEFSGQVYFEPASQIVFFS